MKIIKLTILILAPFLTGFVFAQGAEAPAAWDIAGLFLSTSALAAAVLALTSFVKKNIIKSLTGVGTIAVSVIIGTGFGWVGHLLGYLDGGLVASLGFGASAGILASGGWDAISGLLGKRSAG